MDYKKFIQNNSLPPFILHKLDQFDFIWFNNNEQSDYFFGTIFRIEHNIFQILQLSHFHSSNNKFKLSHSYISNNICLIIQPKFPIFCNPLHITDFLSQRFKNQMFFQRFNSYSEAIITNIQRFSPYHPIFPLLTSYFYDLLPSQKNTPSFNNIIPKKYFNEKTYNIILKYRNNIAEQIVEKCTKYTYVLPNGKTTTFPIIKSLLYNKLSNFKDFQFINLFWYNIINYYLQFCNSEILNIPPENYNNLIKEIYS